MTSYCCGHITSGAVCQLDRLDSENTQNKSMVPPLLVFDFVGVVFTAILYGKYCGIVLVQTTTWSERPVIGVSTA